VGQDHRWGIDLGVVSFGPDTLHDLRSVTKSVTALVYGIALERGLVPTPEEPLLKHFPEYPDLTADPERRRLTVEHALTMTLGLDWNEDAPYTTAANSEIAMERAPDRYRFILERPIVEEPGTRWRYSGGASALVGRLIANGSGLSLTDFALGALFEPLGIDTFEWIRGHDDVPSAASGLRLSPRNLARIGQAVLDRGQWQQRQVIPAAWVEAVLRPRITLAPNFEYGYQWYMGSFVSPGGYHYPWMGGMGNGGQRLIVLPDLDLVVAITAGNYDAPDEGQMALKIVQEVILPSLDG
jgi:CubicO group peptidase (beta-lactamase class C family)